MKRFIAAVVLVAALGALGVAGYLSYQLLVSPPAGEETETTTEEPGELPEEPPEVDLPERVRERVVQDQARRDELFDQARQYHRQGNLSQALDTYREVIGLSGPDDTAAMSYRYLGDVYAEQDELEQAEIYYDYAIDIQPDNPRIRYRRGLVHQRAGRLEASLDDLEQAWSGDTVPDYARAIGDVLRELESPEEAIEAYREGLEAHPDESSILIALGDLLLDQERLDEALEVLGRVDTDQVEPLVGARVLSNRAQVQFQRDEYEEARELWEQARARLSEDVYLYNIATTLLREDEFSRAYDYLSDYLDDNPEDREALRDAGYAQFHMGNREEALEYYRRARELDSGQGNGTPDLMALAELNQQAGNFEQALTHYQQLLSETEDESILRRTFRSVAEIYTLQDDLNIEELDSVDNRLRAAASAYRNALQLDPEDEELRYNLGIVYNRLGETEQAIEELRRAVSIEPENPDYRFLLAQILRDQGQVTEAMKHYNQIANQHRDHFQARYMVHYVNYQWGHANQARSGLEELLNDVTDPEMRARIHQAIGNTHLESGQTEQAVAAYEQALEEVENADALYNLAIAYLRLERLEQATSTLRDALELAGDDPRYMNALGVTLFERGLYEEAEQMLQEANQLAPEDPRILRNLDRVQAALQNAA